MSGRGTMRNGKGGTHRPKHPPAASGRERHELAQLLERLNEALRQGEDYLVSELRRLTSDEGNSGEAARIVKFLYEIRREAHAEAQRLDAAGAAAGTPRDFLGAGLEPEE